MPLSNPYGAVSGALEQTRLSMKDVLDGYLTQKELENRSAIESARAETALAEQTARQAQQEREYGLSLDKVALERQAQRDTANRWQQQLAQQDRATNLTAEQHVAANSLKEKELALHAKQVAQQGAHIGAQVAKINAELAQFKNDNTFDTVANHAKNQGIPTWTIAQFGLDPNQKVPGKALANLGTSYVNMIAKDPKGFGLRNRYYGMYGEAMDLWKILDDPNAGEDKRAPARARIKELIPKLKDVATQIENQPVSTEDLTKAMKMFTDSGLGATDAESRARELLSSREKMPMVPAPVPYGSISKGQDKPGKVVVKKFVSPSTGKTKIVYSDGTEEIQ